MNSMSLKLSVLAAISLLLVGCGRDLNDLKHYVQDVKQRPSRGIEPIPEIKRYDAFTYPRHAKDPFDISIFQKAPQIVPRSNNLELLDKHANRAQQYLESFPVDTLRMVGTIERSGETWALIQTPDRVIQRVAEGNFIGQNYGEVRRITEVGIEFEEIVPDGNGGVVKRESSIALSE